MEIKINKKICFSYKKAPLIIAEISAITVEVKKIFKFN